MSKTRSSKTMWFISGGVALVLLILIIVVAKMLVTDDGRKRRRQIQMVTLVKPPPPPKIKEEIPEPEVKKEEVIEEIQEIPEEEISDQAEDEAPPGEELGLDADGVAGSDAFGLKGKKGGRALIGSGTGGNPYAWYIGKVRHEIEKRVNKVLREEGSVPEEKHETLIMVQLDDRGNIVKYAILCASGNEKVKAAIKTAIKEAMSVASVGEPPPYGMSKKMRFKIMS
jgi:protein TonB